MVKDDFIVWCDDSNMPSPKELELYPPLTPEQKQRLDERLEKVFRHFGLTDEVPPETPADISATAKYILEKQGSMSTWKLQKLCYYAQAWHYTWTQKRLIKQDFQAWKHGPVCRELYNLHGGKFTITSKDIKGNCDDLTSEQKDSIDVMLEHYGNFSGNELAELTHSEEPWRKARNGLPDDTNSENIISIESMGEYYCNHLI